MRLRIAPVLEVLRLGWPLVASSLLSITTGLGLVFLLFLSRAAFWCEVEKLRA